MGAFSNIRRKVGRSVRATRLEKVLALPGDEFIPHPLGVFTHAITIEASRKDVWRWLVQMGAGRAGWYSYDALDNGGRPSAKRVVPRFQNIDRGTLFPALPGAVDGFRLLQINPGRWLILEWPGPNGRTVVSWAFVLRKIAWNRTRLVVRARGSEAYSFHGLPRAVGIPVVHLIHFIMERKQLLGIARRAESAAGPTGKQAA